jgi:hypothetical protein
MLRLGKTLLASLVFLAGITAHGQTPSSKNDEQQAGQKSDATLSAAGKPLDPPGDEIPPGYLPPGTDPENRLLTPFLKHMVGDQVQFWTSPKELRKPSALKTFIPFAGFTGLLIASDSWFAKQVPDKPNQLSRSKNISDYATFSLIGVAAGSYALGHITHNDHMSETGFVSGEAALNSTLIAYAFKEITQRQRPYQGNGHGTFFNGGSSFPSEHSAVAWSVASVVAHEYPSTLMQIAAYGLATTVTLTRVTGKQHFPSDAFVGSALGWYLGRQVYRAHHNPESGGAPWGDLLPSEGEAPRTPAHMGSPYVPLDSWVYPALSRLAAMGYVQSAHLGMRPWTRLECARLLDEASEKMGGDETGEGTQAQKIFDALAAEFADESDRLNGTENLGVSLDSVYTRFTGISGTPLRDGYHFGQTIINDFGRPYGEGFNSADGVAAHAEAGPLAFYVRGEYQHAPVVPSNSPQVLQAIASADLTLPLANGRAEVNRFDLLEGTVAVNVNNFQLSFGKQSQWLGVGETGSLLMTTNAEPLLMFKMDTVSPFRIPLLSKVLGPVRAEYFIGQLAGHQFEFNDLNNTLLGPGNINPQPYMSGYKVSFKPTPDFEFGMGITAQFAGPGLPFTWHNFLRTFYAHTSGSNNPGKRLSELDFSYRVPGIRNWLTIYNDALVVDEISPLGSTRATVNPGVYMPQIPKIPRLELRAEGLHEPLTSEFTPGFVYYGARRFRSGYTNDGNLMGNWIGRAGRGGQGWLTYSLSPRTRFQVGYRLQEVSKDFLGGGRSADYSVGGDVMLSHRIGFSASLQYEQWRFPRLSLAGQSDVTASFQFTFYPNWRTRR